MLQIAQKSSGRALLPFLLVTGFSAALSASSYAMDLSPPYFGTSYNGGANGAGYVFEVTKTGGGTDLRVIYNFCSSPNCVDGSNPLTNVVQMSDGTLIGTTSAGGAQGDGTIFQLTPNMVDNSYTETTLLSFCAYYGDCGRFGYANGYLTLIAPDLFIGTLSGGENGKGLIYTFQITNNGDIWGPIGYFH